MIDHVTIARSARTGGKMLTGTPQLRELATMETSARRWALIESLIAAFQTTFTKLNFQLIAASATVNAQAIVLEQSPCVRIYGGLAFHPLLGSDAITFALLHETGHHLAVGCRQPWNPSIACECLADQYAVNEGAPASGSCCVPASRCSACPPAPCPNRRVSSSPSGEEGRRRPHSWSRTLEGAISPRPLRCCGCFTKCSGARSRLGEGDTEGPGATD